MITSILGNIFLFLKLTEVGGVSEECGMVACGTTVSYAVTRAGACLR